jgi:hypothetical protein
MQGSPILDAGPAPQLQASLECDLVEKGTERRVRALAWLVAEGLVSVRVAAYKREAQCADEDEVQLQVSLGPGIYEATGASAEVSEAGVLAWVLGSSVLSCRQPGRPPGAWMPIPTHSFFADPLATAT